jgi:uncharacterized membrane protein
MLYSSLQSTLAISTLGPYVISYLISNALDLFPNIITKLDQKKIRHIQLRFLPALFTFHNNTLRVRGELVEMISITEPSALEMAT